MKKFAIIQDNKIFIFDERWITLNGGEPNPQHVLIKNDGTVIAGLGGALNGKRLSKVKGIEKPKKKTSRQLEAERLGIKKIEETRKYRFTYGTADVPAIRYILKDGTHIIFPKNYDKSKQTMTPEQAIRLWEQIPENIRERSAHRIEFVDYENPADAKWRKLYPGFTSSYATGGVMAITFYKHTLPHDDEYVKHTYRHETGHRIDIFTRLPNGDTKVRASESNEWKDAMKKDLKVSGRKSPTSYGEVHVNEDFADSVAKYIENKTVFKKDFPNRAKFLEQVVKINEKGSKK